MDPITGVAALTGLTVAALAGLRLKKQMQEGFEVLPSEGDDRYDESVKESQTRYNPLMSMVNPVMNSLLPGQATKQQVESKQKDLNETLGSLLGPYDPTSPEAFKLKDSLNRLMVRTDARGGLFNAVKFCQETAQKNPRPFTRYRQDEFGNITEEVEEPGAEQKMNDTETFKFDEICGVCLTSGIDENGLPFNGRKGMLVDPSVKASALKEQNQFQYPFPRITPSMGKCEGSPNTPAFAIDDNTLQLYTKRNDCMKSKEIDDQNGCALCFENDLYSFVPKKVQKNTINLVLMGVGKCNITADKVVVKNNVILNSSTAVSVPLILNQDAWTFDSATKRWKQVKRILPANEGNAFTIEVTQDPTKPDEIPIVWGYIRSVNPNGGEFAMPLNLILTRDDVTNSAPNRTGGFHKFPENDVEVSKIRPGGETGKEMKLTGEIPFTFVQSSEFSSFDCPSAPYQTQAKSVTRFAADQPCYAKGSGKGKYNNECLRERILAVGCTNGGDLYKDPQKLNTNNQGGPASLTEIYNVLQDIAANNMLDPDKTKLCSGKIIESPCEFFRQQPSLKMEKILDGSDRTNTRIKPAVLKCLTHLYTNKDSTYQGLNQYANDNVENKKLYCLPEGDLNPNKSNDAALELARIYDLGFRGSTGVDGVKEYLNSLLQMAIDERRNGNTDPDRRAAIRKCFGRNFNPMTAPPASTGNPSVQNDPPKYIIRDAANRQWKRTSDNRVRINQGTPIEVDLVARPDVFKNNEGRIGLFVDGNPAQAIRHSNLVLSVSAFQANNFDFAWFPIRGANNTVLFYNDFGGGYVIGYDGPTDSLMLVRVADSRAVSWRITPFPSTFVRDAPSLLVVPKPRVTFAWYGTVYKGVGNNVTATVANALDRGASTFTVSPANLGGDPAPNQIKTLWIDFTPPYSTTVRQFTGRGVATVNFAQLVDTLPTAPTTVTPPQQSLPMSFVPRSGQLLGTAWNNGDYQLTMEINPRQMLFNAWGGIIHFSATGRDCCSPGDRIPGVWFIPSSLRLHIRIGDMNNGNWGVDTATSCSLNQWNRLTIVCQGKSIRITLNQEQISLTQPTTRPRGVATVFAPISGYLAALASVRNFRFTSL
jgi:hypothetical protein